jgi:hypothetical protein
VSVWEGAYGCEIWRVCGKGREGDSYNILDQDLLLNRTFLKSE